MKKYLYLMRVHHYIKNILIFMPLIFSGNLTDRRKFTATLLGMIAFSLVTSAVYIINDIRDAEKDRMHPTKKNRPIASGAVTPFHAVVLMVFILIAAVVLLVVSDATAGSYTLVILYLFINVAYSMGLKDVPLLDVTILASGFLLRVLFGAVLTGTEVSEWLYLTVLSGAFYFSLGKRRNELQIPARCLNIIREISWTKICICAWHCSIHFMHYGVRILPMPAWNMQCGRCRS